MRKALTLLVIFGILWASCKFNPNVQGKGSAVVQGEWQEVPVAYRDDLLQYTQHQFKFSCDSFYLTLSTTAKTNIYPDSCFKSGKWQEYVKGTYVQSHDTLFLKGTFTKSNWRQKISGCYRIGQYENVLIVQKSEKDRLYLRSMSQHIPIQLSLSKRTVCNPKPLD